MTNSFYKKLIAYIFSGLVIFIFAALVFVYSQLKDLDNIKNMVVEKIEKLTGRNVSIGLAKLNFEKGIKETITWYLKNDNWWKNTNCYNK